MKGVWAQGTPQEGTDTASRISQLCWDALGALGEPWGTGRAMGTLGELWVHWKSHMEIGRAMGALGEAMGALEELWGCWKSCRGIGRAMGHWERPWGHWESHGGTGRPLKLSPEKGIQKLPHCHGRRGTRLPGLAPQTPVSPRGQRGRFCALPHAQSPPPSDPALPSGDPISSGEGCEPSRAHSTRHIRSHVPCPRTARADLWDERRAGGQP